MTADVGGFRRSRLAALAASGLVVSAAAAAAPAPAADDARRARPVPPTVAPAVPPAEAASPARAAPQRTGPDAGAGRPTPPVVRWRFAVDVAGARAVAWLEPWRGRSARIGLRCTLAAPASSASGAGFVDVVVDDGLFFRDRRPPALTDRAFRISELRLSFDGPRPRTRTLNARYDRADGRYVTGVALDDPLLEGLMAGYTLWVDEPLAPGRVELTLAGSRDAITQLIDVCP